MSEEGELPRASLEEGLPDPSPEASMASRRKNTALKIESDNTNGAVLGNGDPVPDTNPTSRTKHVLITYAELPEWYRDNEYIVGSYRPESYSTSACFASLIYVHNETVNIYTHMIPAIVFLFAQVFILRLLHQQFPEAKPLDYVVLSFFLLCACITLSLSFMYHTLMNHSRGVSFLWLRLDYVGILALILGDFVSGIRVGFYCNPTLQKIYWSMVRLSELVLSLFAIVPSLVGHPIPTASHVTNSLLFAPQTLTLGILTSILVIHPKYFQGLKYRKLRVAAFVTFGLSGFIPIAHGLIIYGFHRMWAASGLPYYLLEGGLLTLGSFFYATRCPESLKPGKFDIWGCSHSIFHVLVVLATAVHLVGVWQAFAYNHKHLHCAG
jgi:adiponectin receptor